MNSDGRNLRNRVFKTLYYLEDLIYFLVLFTILFILASHFDLFESINIIIVKHETWELDEAISVMIISFLSVFVLSIIRSVKLKKEIRERKKTESDLKASEEHFRSLAEKTNVIPWEADFETRQFTYVGPQVEKALGYPPEKWYEKDFWTIHIHPDDRERTVHDCLERSGRRNDFELEYRMISSEGKVVWVRDFISVVGEDGNPETLRGFMIDTSERKRAEQSLAESENRHRAIIEHTHDLIVETDILGVVLYSNPQHKEIMGYDPQEMKGVNCLSYVHEEDLPMVMSSFQKGLVSRDTVQTAVYRCRHKNGEWRWLESTGQSFETSKGEIHGVISSRDVTERIEAEEKSQEAEERYRALVEHSYDLIIETSADGKFLFANRNHKIYLGYDPSEIIGKSVFDFIHPEDKSFAMGTFMEAARNFTSTDPIILRYKHKDGSWRWLESIGKPFKTASGEIRGVITSRDITERRLEEEKSRESQERYRALVEYSHDLIIEMTTDGKFLFVNQNHKSQLGYDPEELIGTSVFDNIHPEDREAVLSKSLEGLKNFSDTGTMTYRYRHKNGEWRWIESIGMPFKTSSGEIRGVIYSTDITERRMEEEKRREIEERYRTLVENSYDIIAEADSEGRFLYINPKFKELLGYEPEELIDTNIFDNIHEQDRPSVISVFTKALTTDSSGQAVYRYRHKNGDWYWIESTGNTYRTSSGELRAVIASRDITERKRMEEEILKAQKLESLSVLAGGIAHDFNNMLTIVLGNMSIARMGMDPNDKANKRLEEAEKAIERAVGLTRQLLTFSKGGTPDRKSMSAKELLRESTLFALRGSNVKSQFFIKDDLLKVDIDEGQINQVINNLIINAKQAMLDGGVIDVGAENITVKSDNALNLPEGEYIKIYVKDHGIGISEKYLQKIFDPFFTTKEKGSGLGLATSYSIIKQHKGHIAVNSTPGSCTTFTIYLPASEQIAPAAEMKTKTPSRGKGNILILDDDQMIANVLGEITAQLGYTPLMVKESSEAIKAYRDHIKAGNKFDAVILDLTMPGDLGGKETLSKLKEIDPNVNAVITSGYFTDGSMSAYIDFGFKAYISKPYNIYDIGKILHEVTEGTAPDASVTKH